VINFLIELQEILHEGIIVSFLLLVITVFVLINGTIILNAVIIFKFLKREISKRTTKRYGDFKEALNLE